jgi:hypothetical protein
VFLVIAVGFLDTYYSFNKDIVKPAYFDTHDWFVHYDTDVIEDGVML